jgi:hypothetical protein
MNAAAGLAPVFMSLLCTALVVVGSARFCVPPRIDEGAAAHIFQILMAAQLPIALFFVLSKGPKRFVQILPTLALQVLAWGVAAATAQLLT